jgi:hypothetical protein
MAVKISKMKEAKSSERCCNDLFFTTSLHYCYRYLKVCCRGYNCRED